MFDLKSGLTPEELRFAEDRSKDTRKRERQEQEDRCDQVLRRAKELGGLTERGPLSSQILDYTLAFIIGQEKPEC